MNLQQLIAYLIAANVFTSVRRNPLAQFGTAARRYLGPEFLPERPVPNNRYTEDRINYRSVIANHSTRYSPVQIKGGAITGSFDVTLGNSDIGSQLTGSDYEALIGYLRLIGTNGIPTPEAVAAITGFADSLLNTPLVERNEADRWEALLKAQVTLKGDNGYLEVVPLANPAGHRIVGGDWSNPAYDILGEIISLVDLLVSKGYTVNRFVASRPVRTKMLKNTALRQQGGNVTIVGGAVSALVGSRLSVSGLNAIFVDNELPPVETYDLTYNTTTGTEYFFDRDKFFISATTGRNEEIALENNAPLVVPNTLGYVGVGVPTGQQTNGRALLVKAITDTKVPHVEGEGWQTSAPVPTEPEAMAVIRGL